MRPVRSLALVGLVFGCELTAELGAYTADEETSAMSDADTGSLSMHSGDEAGTDGGGETEAGEAESGEAESGEAESGESGDGGGLCEIDGSEDACLICLEHLCCEQLTSCDSELDCNCMLDCLIEFDPVTCATTCAPGLAYFELLQCRASSCAAVCA